MAYSMEISVDVSGDRELFERVSKKMRSPRRLMQMIGVHAMGQATGRLAEVLSADSESRTGRLAASLAVSPGGAGNPDSIFELEEFGVVVGSNVPYAAQVHFGGIIEPAEMKALAIPLLPVLQRQQVWPRDIDPEREILQVIPYTGGKPNVFGLLINPEKELTGRQTKTRGSLEQYPPGPLYALASRVTQEARPFLYWDDQDERVLNEELVPAYLEL